MPSASALSTPSSSELSTARPARARARAYIATIKRLNDANLSQHAGSRQPVVSLVRFGQIMICSDDQQGGTAITRF